MRLANFVWSRSALHLHGKAGLLPFHHGTITARRQRRCRKRRDVQKLILDEVQPVAQHGGEREGAGQAPDAPRADDGRYAKQPETEKSNQGSNTTLKGSKRDRGPHLFAPPPQARPSRSS